LKYKEGFSADLVERLLEKFKPLIGDTILNPFVDSRTISLACKRKSIDSIGFGILPMSKIAISAKEAIYKYYIFELKKLIKDIEDLSVPADYNKRTTYINITKRTCSYKTERYILFYRTEQKFQIFGDHCTPCYY
jgi:DNA modification methylase